MNIIELNQQESDLVVARFHLAQMSDLRRQNLIRAGERALAANYYPDSCVMEHIILNNKIDPIFKFWYQHISHPDSFYWRLTRSAG